VAALGNEAGQKHLTAKSAFEYLVFIEGYARLKQWDKASGMTKAAAQDELTEPQICALWLNLSKTLPSSAADKTAINAAMIPLKCKP